jgi:hypothetical protein
MLRDDPSIWLIVVGVSIVNLWIGIIALALPMFQ